MSRTESRVSQSAGGLIGAALAVLVWAVSNVAFASSASAAVPTNDEIGGATTVTSLPFSESLPYQDATVAGTDPSSCIINPLGYPAKTLWYSISLASDYRVGVTLPASVGVDVFTGTPGDLSLVACHIYAWTFQSEFRFDPTPATTYYVMITVLDDGRGTTVPITFHEAPAGPLNDDFDAASFVSAFDFTDTVTADDATDFFDDPLCTYWHALHTVWYRYTPPADAVVSVTTAGSDVEGALGIYTGDRGALTQIGDCQYYIYGAQPEVSLNMHGGTTYSIMVGTLAEPSGSLTTSIHARLRSTLDLSISRRIVRYPQVVVLRGILNGFEAANSPTVSIYRKGRIAPIATTEVSSDGTFSVNLRPKVNAIYEARWKGDGQYAADVSPRVSVKVRVDLEGKLTRFYSTSGSYHLYHRVTNPRYLVAVAPNHAGHSVVLTVQQWKSGSWRLWGTASFKLSKNSNLAVYVDHRALEVGTRYRIRAQFPSDDDNLGDIAPWSYFRMTS